MKLDFSNLEVIKRAVIERVKKFPENLKDALNSEIGVIKTRTQQGQQVDGGGWSGKYVDYQSASHRAKRTNRGLSLSPVDLTFSGDMLDAMRSKVEVKGAQTVGEIYFEGKANKDKAKGNQKYRKFFGLSKDQRDKITNKLRRVK